MKDFAMNTSPNIHYSSLMQTKFLPRHIKPLSPPKHFNPSHFPTLSEPLSRYPKKSRNKPLFLQSQYPKKSTSTIYVDRPIFAKRFPYLNSTSKPNSFKKITVTNALKDNKNLRNSKSTKPQRRKLYLSKNLNKDELSEITRKKYLVQVNSLLFSKNDNEKVDFEICNLGQSKFITNEVITKSLLEKEGILDYQNRKNNNLLYKEVKLEPIKKRNFKFNHPLQKAKLLKFFKKIDTLESIGQMN